MRERLDYIKVSPTAVLDAGCGAGDDLPGLRERFPEAPVFGTDLSHAMLTRALRHDAGDTSWRRFLPASIGKALGARGPRFAQADFSALPFTHDAFEFIWSNLALHWHSRPDLVFPEWQRVLKVGGLLMFSTLGPDTLKELRGAYAEVEAAHGVPSAKHVIDFVDMHDLGDMLVESGFEIPVMDQETLTITYQSPQSLLADVLPLGRLSVRARGCGLPGHGCRAGVAALVQGPAGGAGGASAGGRYDCPDVRGDLRTCVESRAANDRRRSRDRAARGHWTRSVEESLNRKEGICYV